MFRVIHPNRWFFWAIALPVIVGIAAWGAAERLGIDEDSAGQDFAAISLLRNSRSNIK
jgi:hypothetical protein